jgi:hypothetical protein
MQIVLTKHAMLNAFLRIGWKPKILKARVKEACRIKKEDLYKLKNKEPLEINNGAVHYSLVKDNRKIVVKTVYIAKRNQL